jgi:hypothetical protein
MTTRTSTTTNSNGTVTSSSTSVQVGASGGIGVSPLFTIAVWLTSAFGIGLEFWLIAQASRFYIDGKKNGFLELLLVTPVRPGDIIRGHWLALRKLFLGPVLAMVGLGLVSGMAGLNAVTMPWMNGLVQVLNIVVSQIAWITGVCALIWFAIWMGVTSNKTAVAMLKTFVCVKILPWIGIYFVLFVFMFTLGRFSTAPLSWLLILVPQALMILFNVVLIAGARRMAHTALSQWSAS